MARTRPYYYILDGHDPVPLDDLIAHGQWMLDHEKDCCVARTYLGDGVYCIDTSFLGFDHNFERFGPPVLFETMVRNERTGVWWDEQWRYSTYCEAERGHEHAVEYAYRVLCALSSE